MLTDLPTSLPALPRYGESSLADLATSVLASLGVAGEANPLRLPDAARVCLLVVDGMGWELLREHQAAAPLLSELAVSRPAAERRVPRHDGHQPRVAGDRSASGAARRAGLPGGGAGGGQAAEHAALGPAG